jgi:SAM-dependent methyltransferase
VHVTSFEKMRAFRDEYLARDNRTLTILDVGSGSEAGDRSYRDLFVGSNYQYTGLDLASGPNVDLTPSDPFDWQEVPTDSFDVVISGQTFEHDPYFWITAAEMARVLRPEGLVTIVAPSKGRVHRFPLDCWRFYPDSWAALCTYVGLELVEVCAEPTSWRLVIPGRVWGDTMMVARKPRLSDETESKAFYARLEAVVATRAAMPPRSSGPGRAADEYAQTHSLPARSMVWHPGYVRRRLNHQLRQRWPLNAIRDRSAHRNGRLALARGAARSSEKSL